MHISIGAAILILGLLWLLTFRAGRIVLLTVTVVGGVGVAGFYYWVLQDDQKNREAWAAAQASGVCKEGKVSLEKKVNLGCFARLPCKEHYETEAFKPFDCDNRR